MTAAEAFVNARRRQLVPIILTGDNLVFAFNRE
jgi:hypothetical protein